MRLRPRMETATAGAEKVGGITQSARDQLKGSADMVQAMDHISDVATSNAAATEQVRKVTSEQTAAVQQMASAAQELTNADPLGIAIVTALNLADELHRARAAANGDAQHLSARAAEIERLIDAALDSRPVQLVVNE